LCDKQRCMKLWRKKHTAVLPKTPHSNCYKRVPNRPLRGRRGRFGILLQLLECGIFGRTAVCLRKSTASCAQEAMPARGNPRATWAMPLKQLNPRWDELAPCPLYPALLAPLKEAVGTGVHVPDSAAPGALTSTMLCGKGSSRHCVFACSSNPP